MRHLSTFLLLALSAGAPPSWGGDTAPARTQFHESKSYPFVFRAESYLAATEPVPMRFAPAAPHCPERNAPPLFGAARGVEKPDPAEAAKALAEAAAAKAAAAPEPAHPAPVNGPHAQRDDIDFARVPDDVLDFFKNTEGRPVRRAYLFDPIFQPAIPNELPKSKATHQQK